MSHGFGKLFFVKGDITDVQSVMALEAIFWQ
jgi:hypothetical protein